jgi:hypothetical protein
MVIIVSEISNGYRNLFLVEMEYFGFNTLGIVKDECVIAFLSNFIFYGCHP